MRSERSGFRTAAIAIIVGVVALLALEQWSARFADLSELGDDGYNLLVQGFRGGHLSIARDAPPELLQLADPYDPNTNAAFREPHGLHDLSLYRGKLYLYFGVTPAIVLFWPYAVLTGHLFPQQLAVFVFAALGFGVSVALLTAAWRRYYPTVNGNVIIACSLALGLATGLPTLLLRAHVYEVAISCGYAMVMLALGATWQALHLPQHRARWLAAASTAYGLAIGARPSLAFGAAILLVPLYAAWSASGPGRWRQFGIATLAAGVPIAAIMTGLMVYNFQRFDDPFQFGQLYQLAGVNVHAIHRVFDPSFLSFNFKVYFLELPRWSRVFPFVRSVRMPNSVPLGQLGIENTFGILCNVPLVWFALKLTSLWRGQKSATGALRYFVIATLLGIVATVAVLCTFGGACVRYETEFLPEIMLLATIGVLAVEHARPELPSRWRSSLRLAWTGLLTLSVMFGLMVGFAPWSGLGDKLLEVGRERMHRGLAAEARPLLEMAVTLNPHFGKAHNDLGVVLSALGQTQEAQVHFQAALRADPTYTAARTNLEKLQSTMVPTTLGRRN